MMLFKLFYLVFYLWYTVISWVYVWVPKNLFDQIFRHFNMFKTLLIKRLWMFYSAKRNWEKSLEVLCKTSKSVNVFNINRLDGPMNSNQKQETDQVSQLDNGFIKDAWINEEIDKKKRLIFLILLKNWVLRKSYTWFSKKFLVIVKKLFNFSFMYCKY